MKWIIIILALVSCQEKQPEVAKQVEVIVDQKQDFDSPALVNGTGSDFGLILRAYYLLGNYDRLYELTSSYDKQTMSKQEIETSYDQLDLSPEMKIQSMNEENETWEMNYRVKINATHRLLRLYVIKEESSYKLLLQRSTHP